MRFSNTFRQFDKDRSGNLDKNEFYRCIQSLGFQVPDKERLFKSIDRDGSNRISEREFVEFCLQNVQ